MVNVSTDTYKLFIHPKIKLKKGDRITITQKASGLIFSLFATKPFYYPILLSLTYIFKIGLPLFQLVV